MAVSSAHHIKSKDLNYDSQFSGDILENLFLKSKKTRMLKIIGGDRFEKICERKFVKNIENNQVGLHT